MADKHIHSTAVIYGTFLKVLLEEEVKRTILKSLVSSVVAVVKCLLDI